MKKLAYQFGIIIIGLTVGIMFQFASAWVNPPADPTSTNVGAPITTGIGNQVKTGGLGINGVLTAFSKLIVGNDTTSEGNLLLDVEGRVGATEYCDQNGGNCKSIGTMGGGLTSCRAAQYPGNTGYSSEAYSECAGNEKLTGGSCAVVNCGNGAMLDQPASRSMPAGNGWWCRTSSNCVVAYAVCCR